MSEDMVNKLRSYRNGAHGQFFLDVADKLEDLDSENEDLHIENDTLCKRLQNEQPNQCSACKKNENEDGLVEHGWLVEGSENGRAVWLCISANGFIWSADSNYALRLARPEDGAALVNFLC